MSQIDSIKDLVTDTNLECSATGIVLQAMDSSHVSLVSLSLQKEGFDMFRCDRNLSLGLNLVRGGPPAPTPPPQFFSRLEPHRLAVPNTPPPPPPPPAGERCKDPQVRRQRRLGDHEGGRRRRRGVLFV